MYNNRRTSGRLLQNDEEVGYSYSSYNNASPGQRSSSSYSNSSSQIRSPPPPPPSSNQSLTAKVFLSSSNQVDDEFQDETLYFERNRIQHLKDERVYIQKKTFTKWCNSYLNKVSFKNELIYCSRLSKKYFEIFF